MQETASQNDAETGNTGNATTGEHEDNTSEGNHDAQDVSNIAPGTGSARHTRRSGYVVLWMNLCRWWRSMLMRSA